MSSRQIVRVTPYAEIVVPMNTEKYDSPGTCCGRRVPSPFCSFCGRPVKPEQNVRSVEAVRICDVSEEIRHVLSGHQFEGSLTHIWVPNEQRRIPELPEFDPAYSSEFVAEITTQLVETAISAFKKSFAGALAHMKKLYGTEPRIGFGAVGYVR
jgi:hypothetical protein